MEGAANLLEMRAYMASVASSEAGGGEGEEDSLATTALRQAMTASVRRDLGHFKSGSLLAVTAREEKAGQGRGGRLKERWPHLFLCHSKVCAWVAIALFLPGLEISVSPVVIDFDFWSDIGELLMPVDCAVGKL